MNQLISRGRRKAPVKKIRHRCSDDRAEEHQRRPVVHLADQQPGAHVEAEVHDRVVRLGHVLTPRSGT